MARVVLDKTKSGKKRQEEDKVKKSITDLLDKHKWFWFKPPANMYGGGGISDILALKAGVFLAIEAKSKDNKPTALQKGFLQSVMAESGFGFVVNEENMFHLENWLDGFDNAVTAGMQKQMPQTEDGSKMLNAIAAMTRPF